MNKNGLKWLWDNLKLPLIAIVLGFVIGAVFIIIAGSNPIVAYTALFKGSMGGLSKIGETLYKTTPLIFTGLAVAFAFRTGLFNIGAEGQYIVGSITAIAIGWYFQNLPGIILLPLILIFGALAGGIWASIAGFLKARFGVHEVITTIMLNYTALIGTNYIIRTVLNPQVLQGTTKMAFSVSIPEKARLSKLSEFIPQFGYSSAHTGIFIGIICALAIYFILFKTTLGYEIRSVGFNPEAAEYGGISKKKNIVLAMFISGLLAGLAGAVQVTGLIYKVNMSAGMSGYGFDGIAVALVGGNHPIGVLASALLFGVLSNGARKMQLAGIPKEVIGIIQGVIIIFIAGKLIVQLISKRKKTAAHKEAE
ncbi:MAG TPA: ABC transporter permease [Clostridia bacterium]|nr:ABC transporter permease [Clostridia bacterium]